MRLEIIGYIFENTLINDETYRISFVASDTSMLVVFNPVKYAAAQIDSLFWYCTSSLYSAQKPCQRARRPTISWRENTPNNAFRFDIFTNDLEDIRYPRYFLGAITTAKGSHSYAKYFRLGFVSVRLPY